MKLREQRVAEVRRLRAQGLLFREIAEHLGINRRTAHQYFTDPDGSKARARKAKRCGVCIGCGCETHNSGGEPPPRCRACNGEHVRAQSRAWVIESMREWNDLFGAPPSATDWNPALARSGYSAWKADRHESTGRPWPSGTLVQKNFGSWNKGLIAAGFTPLSPSEHWIGHAGMALMREDQTA